MSALRPFKPGQSGNPNGRPKGSRNKLGEAFVADLYADWTDNGKEVIERVRKERPQDYLKVVASLLPKELKLDKASALDAIGDDELARIIDVLKQVMLAGSEEDDDVEGNTLQ